MFLSAQSLEKTQCFSFTNFTLVYSFDGPKSDVWKKNIKCYHGVLCHAQPLMFVMGSFTELVVKIIFQKASTVT